MHKVSCAAYSAVRIFRGFLLFLSAIGLFVVLNSFSPKDPSAFYYSDYTQTVMNKGGIVGAQLAALLFFLFGSAAFLWIPFMLFASYLCLAKRSLRLYYERLAAFAFCILLGSVMLYRARYDYLNFCPGGACGAAFWRILVKFFDEPLATLFLYTLMTASVLLVLQGTGIRLISYAVKFCSFLLQLFIVPVLSSCYRTMRDVAFRLRSYMFRKRDEDFSPEQDQEDPAVFPFDDALQDMSVDSISLDENSDDNLPAYDACHVADEMDEEGDTELYVDEADLDDAPEGTRYALPDLTIFVAHDGEKDDPKVMQDLQEDARTLEDKLRRFNVNGSIVSIKRGPVVTLFEYEPDINSKISKIIALEDDLALALQALSIRIIAPIPGKPLVGFEVSNRHRREVLFAEVIKSPVYADSRCAVPLVLGHDTIGNNVVVDLVRMPHLLVAGSTGSGKSVALNGMLISMLCKMTPDELRLILIDPKRLEFSAYADIAHLLFPIVTQPKKAAPVLKWVVQEMENRYERMATEGGRNIHDYNLIAAKQGREKLPYIVVVIDELADLMMTAGRDIEELIARITQMARAAGIHLIVATQRPSVDVITGLIKVNFPSRISFRVTSKIDSRTILDCGGADKLLGRGDMLFLDPQGSGLRRLHGAYVSDQEIERVVSHIRLQRETNYLDLEESLDAVQADQDKDEIYQEVLDYLQEIDEVSISLLQRKFKIGYNRSARIIDMLEAEGWIAPSGNGKTRTVIR